MMLIGVDLRSSAAINVFFTAPQGALPHGRGSDWGTRALYWSHPHARYALAPAGGNSRDPRRRGLPISGTKKAIDRKSTRLNSSHLGISYAVFCLKKKK